MQQERKTIVAVHLLNDFSGSPLVFTQALKGLQDSGHKVVLHTSGKRDGFLSSLSAQRVHFPYRFYKHPVLRLFAFFFSQFVVFKQLLRYRKENVVIYVNTLLPFGAALAGKLTGKPVVYHIHESYIRPRLLKLFLKTIARYTAGSALYVSHYLEESEKLKGVPAQVVYNALPDEFVSEAADFRYHPIPEQAFSVLMVCSLKTYKGVHEFISLAERHPRLRFELVLNATGDEIYHFFGDEDWPKNLHVYPVQKNLHPFYRKASIVVNLTNPANCIETFGMTLLEAMCYGIPVIAPPVGGPSEFVEPGTNGFAIDVRHFRKLDELLEKLADNPEECAKLSEGARKTASRFRCQALQSEIKTVIERL